LPWAAAGPTARSQSQQINIYFCEHLLKGANYIMSNTEKLTMAFAEALAVPAETITDELAYQSIPEWDSITHMILISQLEDTFSISIETDDVIDMSSVAKAKEILTRYNISFN
jgi:acyl carrier protein